jgi:hypothetical protein
MVGPLERGMAVDAVEEIASWLTTNTAPGKRRLLHAWQVQIVGRFVEDEEVPAIFRMRARSAKLRSPPEMFHQRAGRSSAKRNRFR